MNINEYSVQELKESEILCYNGGMMIFLTGVIIGIMLNNLYHDTHPYG